jgi:hypothetical protein
VHFQQERDMPSQFDDAEEAAEVVRGVSVAKTILQQEASKYGSASLNRKAPAVATTAGGRFPAYGQDRYTPVLPTEFAEAEFRGLEVRPKCPQFPAHFT